MVSPIPMTDPTQTLDSLPQRHAAQPCLVVLTGSRKGHAFWLEQPRVVVGRADDATIQIDDVSVSRYHAELNRGQETWLLKDLDSKNGSFLGDRPLTIESPIRDGDLCRFGTVTLQFFMVQAVQAMDTASLHAAGLRLDSDQMVARLGDAFCALTEIEFRMLAALMRRPGRVLSTLALMRAAYPREHVVAEATVASHLRNLRKKLSDLNGGEAIIRSHYGRGYSISESGQVG